MLLETLRDLIAHKGHANAALLRGVQENEAAAADAAVLELLHHILLANRFWQLAVVGSPFVFAAESRPADSFAALVQRFARMQAEEQVWLDAATEADLARTLIDAQIPGGSCSIGQALVQVCLHSHGHRAQLAKLLRRHGATPPAADFILWLTTRPEAVWPPE
jgi:uncharacterized damage-inducible protein DinB